KINQASNRGKGLRCFVIYFLAACGKRQTGSRPPNLLAKFGRNCRWFFFFFENCLPHRLTTVFDRNGRFPQHIPIVSTLWAKD
ncbi:MAG: hypothetical protein KC434_18450, partial [Anaerolineales bacterium]|nr:hypothetical protein [Anaerolineales bacterium]